ncbi:MAG: RNA-directed DNA polymerase, partial [Paraglaciecola sp.]
MLNLSNILNSTTLDAAYSWLCKQRANFPANADIWHLRFHWNTIRGELLQTLNKQDYTFMPLSVITKADGETLHLWSSQDALVLKMLAMALPEALALSPLCTHIKGHGGLKTTVSDLHAALPGYSYVMKTDVKGYYESIDHTILLKQLDKDITDPFIWRLLVQFVKRTVERGGTFKSIHSGISRGCPLSPVIAAYYLKGLDEQMEGDTRYFYRRFMDDVIVLAKTRWHLRKAVRIVNQHFHQLKVEQAPDKTFIGKISKGWDFLGYHFDGKQLTVAAKTVEKHVVHYRQLYEQLRKKKGTSVEMAIALGQYVKRWQRWVAAGLQGIKIGVYVQIQYQQVLI